MRVLHLTLKKKWFDLIASGGKKCEYRELKHYWKVRLEETYYEIDYDCPVDVFKQFDIVRFRNGYGKNARTIDVEFKGISIGEGRNKWGAEIGRIYYCINLGELTSQPITTPSGDAIQVHNTGDK